MAANPNFQNAKELVGVFLKKEAKSNWPRELKIAYKLLDIYPEIEYWKSKDLLFYKLNSLAYFLQEESKKELESSYKTFKTNFAPKPQNYKLEQNPVIQIEQPDKKFKSVLEFLDN